MKRKNLLLTAAATAVLGIFNPAFAGGDAKHSSADDASSSPRAEQGQPGTQSARQSSRGNVQFGHSDMTLGGIGPQANAERSQDVDAQTGLDRGHPAN